MRAEQLPESALDWDLLRVNAFSSDFLSLEVEIANQPFQASYRGYQLDTDSNPYLNQISLRNQITDAYLLLDDFSHRADSLSVMLVNGLDSIEFLSGDDEIYGDKQGDSLIGYGGKDEIWGFEGNDFIHGNSGADELWGGEGDDTIRGGKGPDEIYGGDGSDLIWGDLGKNTITAGWNDFSRDQIFVTADRVENKKFGNPGGVRVDIIKGLEENDALYIHGVEDSTLTFSATSFQGSSGIGVYSEGVLEAIVEGYGWTPAQVDAITSGGFYA